ncbi:Tetratricopeptide repeat protein 38 [Stylophora pistillata]|uniref:Tetratricopeptide repeat protein 38 n=1 Tax=Stylophora pistillata TaxID=50429 RepID=A0A2B4REG5_STYPI|nr:Tetratricopeptide repeat protein 38 [Stylophora pistillata]
MYQCYVIKQVVNTTAYMLEARRSDGLPLTTSSNDAAKMFDATLTQDGMTDNNVNGIEGSVSKRAVDLGYKGISFLFCLLMGHVISCGLDLISSGKGIHTDQELKSSMLSLKGLAARSNITNRERLHVKAVKEWAQGWLTTPTSWIPTSDQRFNRKGDAEMKGNHSTLWVDGLALTVLSIQSVFSLSCVEDPAFLSEGLELSPRDCWSTHAEAHVIEMEGRQDDGIKVLSTTLNDWTVFNDVHVLMCTMGAKKEDATLTLMMSLRDFVRDGSGTNCEVPREEHIDREKGNERNRSNDRLTHGAGPCFTCGVKSETDS